MATRKLQQRTIDTRAAIMRAAAQLFADRGYAATGVRDVAQLAGCNQALVSYHFKGKAGLYDAVVAEGLREFVRNAAEVVPSEGQPLRTLIKGFAAAFEASPHMAPILLREYMKPNRLLEHEPATNLRRSMALTEAMVAALPDDAPAKSFDVQTIHMSIVAPLLMFHVATPIREEMAKRDPTITTPTLAQFADQLAEMLEPSIE